VITVYTIQ